MASMFRNAIDFFGEIGLYDVVLPFLLVFTVVFAILEKSRIFGYVEIDGNKFSRKNLNSMVAFCLGFIAVASTRIVTIINEGLGNIMVVMVAVFSFLLLAGSFFSEGEFIFDEKFGGLRIGLIVTTLIITILIFLHAIKTEDGKPWLVVFWEFIAKQWDSTLVASIIMLGIMAGFVFFIVRDKKGGDSTKE